MGSIAVDFQVPSVTKSLDLMMNYYSTRRLIFYLVNVFVCLFIQTYIHKPKNSLPYLQPGRLIQVCYNVMFYKFFMMKRIYSSLPRQLWRRKRRNAWWFLFHQNALILFGFAFTRSKIMTVILVGVLCLTSKRRQIRR